MTEYTGPTPTHKLHERLAALTPRALARIEASLSRGGLILVGEWQKQVHGKKCGCLMMDGYAGRSRGGRSFESFLADKYHLPDLTDEQLIAGAPLRSELIALAAFAFDDWAKSCRHRTRIVERSHGFGDIRVLSGRGKRECLAIVRRAQRTQQKAMAQ